MFYHDAGLDHTNPLPTKRRAAVLSLRRAVAYKLARFAQMPWLFIVAWTISKLLLRAYFRFEEILLGLS